jgi:hypothetical protein
MSSLPTGCVTGSASGRPRFSLCPLAAESFIDQREEAIGTRVIEPPVLANLTDADILDLVAYIASL